MSPWTWWAGIPDDESYALAEASTRDDVIKAALEELVPGDTFEIIEARSSDAKKWEGGDFVPFLRSRNHEVFVVGPDGKAIPEGEASPGAIAPCYCGGDHANGHAVDCPAPAQIDGGQP